MVASGLWIFIQLAVGINLLLPLVLYLAHLFVKKPIVGQLPYNYDYGVIVTAYEQMEMLPRVLETLLNVNYQNFLIYIVADNCDTSSLQIKDPRIILLEPPEILASNTKSHLFAIQNFRRKHEVLTIIDSDNLTHPDYFKELNLFFNLGFEAVQGTRSPKNLDSTYACLDAARDIYYHFYDGELMFQLGSSATLSGSGMAFKVGLYLDCMKNYKFTGAGFDKVLQASIVGKGLRIAFAKDAVVYDEKTSNTKQLINQRSRWINTWFKYFKYGFGLVGKGTAKASFNQFLFGIILLRPPLFLFIILSIVFALVNILVAPILSWLWLSGLLIFILTFFLALGSKKTDIRIYRSLVNIPKFMFIQVLSLFYSRNANKRSVATKHNTEL